MTTVQHSHLSSHDNSLCVYVFKKIYISCPGVGVLGGQLYAAGGHDGPLVRKSVEVYDPQTNTWRLVCDMNMCRRNAGQITTGDTNRFSTSLITLVVTVNVNFACCNYWFAWSNTETILLLHTKLWPFNLFRERLSLFLKWCWLALPRHFKAEMFKILSSIYKYVRSSWHMSTTCGLAVLCWHVQSHNVKQKENLWDVCRMVTLFCLCSGDNFKQVT